MKVKRGRRISLRVSTSESYYSILTKSVQKWKEYHHDCFFPNETYQLVYITGKEAIFLPGTTEPFSLKRYQQEIGKDYKRIALYLCTDSDMEHNENFEQNFLPESTSSSPTCQFPDIPDVPDVRDWDLLFPPETTIESVLSALRSKVEDDGQFYFLIRRGAELSRILSIWKHTSQRTSVLKTLRVHFSGEQGIDSGALSREFLADAVSKIQADMFFQGVPKDSMLHLSNKDFEICGQIIATSLVQGGPAPHCLDLSAYNLMFKRENDLGILDINKDLPSNEKIQINNLLEDPNSYTEFILEHGYTGRISSENNDLILNTLMASIISRRIMYLKSFSKGLEIFGLMESVKNHKDLFQKLFVTENDQTVDSNYIMRIITPILSAEGSQRRVKELQCLDFFQDFLLEIENNPRSQEVATTSDNDDFACAKVNITTQGVLGWLTGQRHKPFNGSSLSINMKFEHDCLSIRGPHEVCYPNISSCASEITLPVLHMNNSTVSIEILTTAYFNGQSFGKA